MDEVFRALADPSRRLLLDSLNERDGQSLRELCAGLSMARQSVSKHLAVLESAGLVRTAWRGREKLHHLNAGPIADVAEHWMDRYRSPTFRYTTYIGTTPARLWHAITDPASAHHHLRIAGAGCEIRESHPYRRLAFTCPALAPGSTVSLDIEPLDDQVRLTLIHDGFATGSTASAAAAEVWPVRLADLKTALERPWRADQP